MIHFVFNIIRVDFIGTKSTYESSKDDQNLPFRGREPLDENELYKDHEFLNLFQEVTQLRNFYSTIKKR